MPDDCNKDPVMWNPVKAGSKFCAQSSAKDGATKSTNYDCTVEIDPGLGGPAIIWTKNELDPGPAELVLQDEGYGVVVSLQCFGPPASVRVWITPPGEKVRDCTWTNSTPGTELRKVMMIVART